jgi:putative lipoprotein
MMINSFPTTLLSRRRLLGLTALALTLPAVPARAKTRTLYGTVNFSERIALPPYAILEVSIVDSSIDEPANVFASTRVRTRNRLPIPYRLRFDDKRIRRGSSYVLQARILVDGKVWFATPKRYMIHGPVQPEILVERIAAETPEHPTPKGKWLAESIRNAGVIDKQQSMIEIAADGKVAGKGGCNGFGGTATIAGDKISFASLVATRMACPPAVMDQETKFLSALNDARRWMIDDQRGKLILFDSSNREILLLARM